MAKFRRIYGKANIRIKIQLIRRCFQENKQKNMILLSQSSSSTFLWLSCWTQRHVLDAIMFRAFALWLDTQILHTFIFEEDFAKSLLSKWLGAVGLVMHTVRSIKSYLLLKQTDEHHSSSQIGHPTYLAGRILIKNIKLKFLLFWNV